MDSRDGGQVGGWITIFKGAPNVDLAKQLALDLLDPKNFTAISSVAGGLFMPAYENLWTPELIAADPNFAIIKEELLAIKEKHANARLTQIVADEGEMAIEDLIANEGVIITITHNGLIKRTNVSSYRAQRRGGKGVIGMTTREAEEGEEGDFVEHLFTASTHDYLMFFTNKGRVYVERVG